MNRALVGGASIAIVVVYALGAGRWVSTDAGWYRSLVRPPWQPPDVVFGIIWPYNFVMLGVAGWTVAGRESRAEQTVWLVSLALLPNSVRTFAERIASTPFLEWLGPQLTPFRVIEGLLIVAIAAFAARSAAVRDGADAG